MPAELEAILTRPGTNASDAFAQIHLGTAAERAVFRRFATDPDTCWSDVEIALGARLDLAEVRWAIERFAEAGIVEMVEQGCYRWQPRLRYAIDRAEPETERRDPVCEMPVSPDTTYRADDVFGRTERFCSQRCMAAFLVWPLVFTRPPGGESDRVPVEDDRGP